MTSKSKAKGGSWERDVANYLSALYGESFIRVPHSGAFTGGANAIRKTTMTEGQVRHMKGDIVPPDGWLHFNAEAKNYAEFPFHRLLMSVPVPILEDWLKQLMQAADPGDVNVLFFKITRLGKFIAYEKYQPFTSQRFIDYKDNENRIWTITEFDSFFELNSDSFKNAIKS